MLLQELKKENLKVMLQGDKLKITPQKKLTADLVAKIKQHKQELIRYLKIKAPFSCSGCGCRTFAYHTGKDVWICANCRMITKNVEAQTVQELKALLKKYPVRIIINNGVKVRCDPDVNWQIQKRISRLVFFDDDVWKWLAQYNGYVIDLHNNRIKEWTGNDDEISVVVRSPKIKTLHSKLHN